MMFTTMLTCPNCGWKSVEAIPEHFDRDYVNCDNCHQMLERGDGDCCVFRTIGDAPCRCELHPGLSVAQVSG
jgi:hypothetical protein